MMLHLFIASMVLITITSKQVEAAEISPFDTITNYHDIFHPVIGKKGMVVSQSVLASEVGAKILRQGGNAIDAAVAIGYTLAVTLPRAGNLGGGGFMLVHLANKGTIAIDYRETAPQNAYREMFLDKNGKPDQYKSLKTLAAAGVPGTVAGLNYALEHYGSMSLSQVIQPAIEIALNGVTINEDMLRLLNKDLDHLKSNAETCRVFFKKGCQLYQSGDVLKQPDLAKTLSYLSIHGSKGFYQGRVAKAIVNAMQNSNGLITASDLANYRAKEVSPLKGTFNGYQIMTMPLPSSGGVHLIQMLNILEALPFKEMVSNSAALMHYQSEIFKRAYADRSTYLGDPDFVDVPVAGLISKKYATDLAKTISARKVTPSDQIKAGKPLKYESPDTTHFSVIDSEGNAVSNTYTLNHYFGSGITIPGTGILMNNTMDDFSAKPGSPNSYGLVGGEANAISAHKRPLSSMTPTIVLKDNKPYIITGTPGGSKIITTVFQQLVNVLLFNMSIAEATNRPRIHHQWQPDILYYEKGVSPDTLEKLTAMGYKIENSTSLGSLQSIMIKDGLFFGAADPRRPDAKAIAVD